MYLILNQIVILISLLFVKVFFQLDKEKPV